MQCIIDILGEWQLWSSCSDVLWSSYECRPFAYGEQCVSRPDVSCMRSDIARTRSPRISMSQYVDNC